MTNPFNPYSVSITATEKAIKDRKAKIAAQEELENLAIDFEARGKLAMEIGRLEAEVIMQTGAKKKAAEKKLKELERKLVKVRNAFDGNGSKLTLKWHREIVNLEDALSNLKRLKEQWERRESLFSSYQ